jgi:hypothetical protein
LFTGILTDKATTGKSALSILEPCTVIHNFG